jgi:hypothetical protein
LIFLYLSITPTTAIKLKTKVLAFFTLLLVILVATNPTQKDFDNFLTAKYGADVGRMQAGRLHYYFIFSTYQYSTNVEYYLLDNDKHKTFITWTYTGVLKNFIETNRETKKVY